MIKMRFLKSLFVGIGFFCSLTIANITAGYAQQPIKIGFVDDQSGELALAGMAKYHAIQVAIKEINDGGGIAGRPVELIAYDAQSDNRRYQEFTRRVLLSDKVDVLFAGTTSASREAYRPIVDQLDKLAFYNDLYEGGVCDSSMIITGTAPEQQISPLIPWMIKKYGPKMYTITADYNFGQISADWVKKIAEENGGEVLGAEFIPLGVSQFSQTIQNIQAAKPDFVVVMLVGTAQSSYFEQAAAANLNLPMASNVHIVNTYEHKQFKAPALNNMYIATSYVEDLDTPASNKFKDLFHEMFPDEPYVGQDAEATYTAMMFYKKMVETAGGSTKKSDLLKTLADGNMCIDAPEGHICIDPKSQHVSHTIYLMKIGEKHEVTFLEQWDNIQPYWLGDIGCDLRKSNPATQYTPTNLPK